MTNMIEEFHKLDEIPPFQKTIDLQESAIFHASTVM